jgi:hypothetical protein
MKDHKLGHAIQHEFSLRIKNTKENLRSVFVTFMYRKVLPA